MRGKAEQWSSRSWRDSKKSKGENTCPTSNEWPAGRTIPDIFKVAVRGLSRLLVRGQVQLFRKLPQPGSVKDPCLRRHKDS